MNKIYNKIMKNQKNNKQNNYKIIKFKNNKLLDNQLTLLQFLPMEHVRIKQGRCLTKEIVVLVFIFQIKKQMMSQKYYKVTFILIKEVNLWVLLKH